MKSPDGTVLCVRFRFVLFGHSNTDLFQTPITQTKENIYEIF